MPKILSGTFPCFSLVLPYKHPAGHCLAGGRPLLGHLCHEHAVTSGQQWTCSLDLLPPAISLLRLRQVGQRRYEHHGEDHQGADLQRLTECHASFQRFRHIFRHSGQLSDWHGILSRDIEQFICYALDGRQRLSPSCSADHHGMDCHLSPVQFIRSLDRNGEGQLGLSCRQCHC